MSRNIFSGVRSCKPVIKTKTLPDSIILLKKVMQEKGIRNMDLKINIYSSGNINAILKQDKPLFDGGSVTLTSISTFLIKNPFNPMTVFTYLAGKNV